jgi:hypothetical protein
MTLSTTSGRGVRKSLDAISGLKKISGARKRSKPTSTLYCYKSRGYWGLLRSKVDRTYATSHAVLAFESGKVFERVGIVFAEFFDNVLAHVTGKRDEQRMEELSSTKIPIVLLDLLSNAKLVLWWNGHRLTALAKEILNKASNIAPSYGNVLDRRANNITLGLKPLSL